MFEAPTCPHCGSPLQSAEARCPQCPPAGQVSAATQSLPADAHLPGRARSTPRSAAETAAQHSTRPHEQPELPARIGRFEVREWVGEGSFAEVYRAYDPNLDREVALKLAKPGALGTPRRVKRFRGEARAAGNLRHPNIVPLFEIGEDAGRHFLVSAFIRGRTLGRVLDETKAAGGPLPVARAARIVQRLAEALAYAHGEGVVHRDVKSENVMVDDKGEPLLMDFGLAARADPDEGEERLTQHGIAVGTPAYMAPEQARADLSAVGPAADQYALGCTLYELLTGHTPFSGPPDVQLLLHQTHAPPSPRKRRRDVPRDLETICLKCLEKEPNRRYPDCRALAEDLRRWCAGEPISARRPGPAERLTKWIRRNPAVAALMAAVVASLSAGTAVSYLNYRDARAARTDAADRADREALAKDEARQALAAAEANLYFASLTLAEREWAAGDFGRYRQALAQAPPAIRRWEWEYLDRRGRELFALSEDATGLFGAVAFSPDGARLATAGGGAVRVWDALTGRPVATLTGDGATAGGVAWAPDGRALAVGDGRLLRVWDLTDPDRPRVAAAFGPHKAPVIGVAHHPTAAQIAVAVGDVGDPSAPGEVVVWDCATGRQSLTLTGHKGAVYAVAFSPDGSQLATGGEDETAVLWDARTGRAVATLDGHKSSKPADGERILRIRDGRGREARFSLMGRAVLGVAFAPDGRTLATASGDGTLKLWSTADRKELLTLSGHTQSVLGVAFSPTGKSVASAGMDGTVRLWSVATGRELRRYLGHRDSVAGVAFRPSRRDGLARLATGGADGTVKVWDPDQPQEGHVWRDHGGNVFGLAFSPDGRTAAAGTGDLFNPSRKGGIRVFDLAEKRDLFALPGHTSGVGFLAYSPDGARLASGGADGTVKVWDGAGRKEVWEGGLKGHVFGIAYSPDGASVAACSGSVFAPWTPGELKVWDAATGALRHTLSGPATGVGCVAYSPDGKFLAAGYADRTMKVWDAATGHEVRTLTGPAPLFAVAWSPDGKSIAAAGGDIFKATEPGEVRVWDAETGAERLALKGHTQLVNGVAFTADGERIVTGSRDGTVRRWDARTGREVCLLRASSYVCRLAVSADGRWVGSGNWSGAVNLWEGASAKK